MDSLLSNPPWTPSSNASQAGLPEGRPISSTPVELWFCAWSLDSALIMGSEKLAIKEAG
jgi:hypothetical protein